MPSYTFKVIGEAPEEVERRENIKIGDIIEVDMKITEYDAFKANNSHWLDRIIEEAPAFTFDDKVRPPGKFMEKLNHIKHTYPGAKDMFKDAKYQPPREW
jgi:hypothetical protein